MHGLLLCLCSTLASPLISKVVISGGTHGNECAAFPALRHHTPGHEPSLRPAPTLSRFAPPASADTGVHVLSRLALRREKLAREYPSLSIERLLANPAAHESNRRFMQSDLNRMFTEEKLCDISASGYEPNRAKAINAVLGPKGPASATDMCIDLHTTTANMGCTLIVDQWCPLAIHAAAYVQRCWAEGDGTSTGDGHGDGASHPLRVLLHRNPHQAKAPYVCSVAKNGMQIEVGPIPQGMLRADCTASTERALRLILRFLELHNAGASPKPPATIDVYADKGKVPWEAAAPGSRLPGSIVHPSLQDRDFATLSTGDPLFVRTDGTVQTYDGVFGDAVYPIFLNEAAYYNAESGIGVTMCERIDWPVPKLE